MALFGDSLSVTGHPRERVLLTELERSAIRVSFSYVPTLLAVADGICGRDSGVPSSWLRAGRQALAGHDLEVLEPVVTRPRGFVPDCVLQLPDGGVVDVDPVASIRQMAARAVSRIVPELQQPGAPGPDGIWSRVAAEPRTWAVEYALALLKIWDATKSELGQSGGFVVDEIQRVRSALARGSIGTVFERMHPSSSVRDGAWSMPGTRDRVITLASRGLTLVPILSGAGSPAIRAYAGDALTHIAYPWPAHASATAETGPDEASLEDLLGPQRSTILRSLDSRQPVGALAEALQASPGTATHHVAALERAGLVLRERRGRMVLVSRTLRGTALLTLFEPRGVRTAPGDHGRAAFVRRSPCAQPSYG